MSFSAKVKTELTSQIGETSTPRHCRLAEIAALLSGSGWLETGGISFSSESRVIAKHVYTLMLEAFARAPSVSAVVPMQSAGKRVFTCSMFGAEPTVRAAINELQGESLLSRECCKRAYIRGAFLVSGSLSDPAKHYHLEFVNYDKAAILLLRETIAHFAINMGITLRKGAHVLYVKDGERIALLLSIMGAHKLLMEFENVRIVKEVRNNINRKVNFETANLSKTVNAAVSQEADIKYILENGESGLFSRSLTDVAKLRLQYPSASLKEIGEMLSPPISKSAVNHRLRKISAIAEKLRGEKT